MNDTTRPGAGEQLWTLTLAQFRDAAAGKGMPGCGAVAAVVADFGLALVVKALRISEKNERQAKREELLRSAQALLGRLGAFADDDVAAFQHHLDAEGREAQQSATRQACAVPLATAHACNQALAITETARPLVTESLRCDVEAGALLIGAAIDAVLLNVQADLAGLEDPGVRNELREKRETLQAEAHDRLNRMGLLQLE